MIKSHAKSKIEVWSKGYINNIEHRREEDETLIILQIESGFNNDYMVEVIKPEDYKNGYFSMKGDRN